MKLELKKRYDNIVAAVRKEKFFYLFALLAMLLAGVYVAIMHTRTLSPAEGWYTYYSQCIHAGQLPYRDFEYLYPPAYIYTIALFTKIFGYELIALRRFGILLFAAIALGIYLSVTVVVGKKKSWIALIASTCAVFFMQSEVVQIFYDYVRLMDAVAAFCLYALLRVVKGMLEDKAHRGSSIALGILCGALINIKQNVGLIFTVFAFALLVYVALWCKHSFRRMVRDLFWVIAPLLGVMLVVLLLLLISGSLVSYFSMTGLGAAGAKGGMKAILFGWIVNNWNAIRDGFHWATIVLVLIVAMYGMHWWLQRKGIKAEDGARDLAPWIAVAFAALFIVGLIVMALARPFAELLMPPNYLNPYAVFVVVTALFVIGGVWGIVDMVKKKQTMRQMMLPFALAGAYFAIAFSCGNSGGIAEGQSSFGVACIVTVLLLFADNVLGVLRGVRLQIVRYAVCGTMALVALVTSLHLAGKKMINTYNWWGMDESDYWVSTQETDVPLLRGIKVSAQTKAMYEGVYHAVKDNTTDGDDIFCFPQIPLFYSACSRTDPGTMTKVQWFDVASDTAVRGDIERLKSNPPKAILIYNTTEGAYAAHENAFRSGQVSATREMREFLYTYIAEQGYCFKGNFAANSNSIAVWVQGTENPVVPFEKGCGTKEDPFVIATEAQFLSFADMVNAGRTFYGRHILQAADIDLGGRQINAIGSSEDGISFAGIYNGGGHVIRNAVITEEETDLALFASLSGTVMNLGVEGLTVTSDRCAAGLVCHSADANAAIVNCFVNATVTGYRAGGIADDFFGRIENCIFVGTVQGESVANAISMPHASGVKNVYLPKGFVFAEEGKEDEVEERVTEVSAATLNSAALADILNAYVDKPTKSQTKEGEESVDIGRLLYWTVGENGHVVLVP